MKSVPALTFRSTLTVGFGVLCLMLFSLHSIAQSGGAAINSTSAPSHPSAMLDVSAADKGLLIPRVALTGTDDITTIADPAQSLLVYNTAPAGISPNMVYEGFYYWNGTKWVPVRPTGNTQGDMQFWNGSDWVMVPIGQPGQILQISQAGIPTWTGAAYPVVTTYPVSDIFETTATGSGEVTDNGGATITAQGVCWSTSPNPTLADPSTNSGSGGTFSTTMTGLTALTTYYVRAYATNSVGTTYGNEVSFSTILFALPTVTTAEAFDITQNGATLGGDVLNDGGSPVTTKGCCWSTSPNPTTSDPNFTIGGGTGPFAGGMGGLTGGTVYYVRAYATNVLGTGYGNEVTFTTTLLTVPTLTTNEVTFIEGNYATGGGNVELEGGVPVTARGVCWSTSPNPTTADPSFSSGSGLGSFTGTLTGLDEGTLYYVRAYATNSEGTGYGNQVSFTTVIIAAPTLTTNPVSPIQGTYATGGGDITFDGGIDVTERGVCWSTSPNPTTLDPKSSDGAGIGTFSSSIIGLLPSTTYYVRAFAINAFGTAYGNEETFTTNAVVPPSLSTTSPSYIHGVSMTSGGSLIADGGANITSRGVCWSTSANPTVADSKTIDGAGMGGYRSIPTGLTVGTLYYIRAYATNELGTSGYGDEYTFTTAATLQIGDYYQGGIIGYILVSGDPGYVGGQHGLIVTTETQSYGLKWSNTNTVTTATATALGTGNANTNTIVANQGAGSYAAQLCADLSVGGYSDWYLPSKDELNKIWLNRGTITPFQGWSGFYWSSSDSTSTLANRQSFGNGAQSTIAKSTLHAVRPVRTF